MSEPQAPIRPGATRVEVFNSGLEAWIYDEANADAIRAKGLWRKLVDGGATDGHLVGYSLRQDDGLSIDVVVGAPLTEKELAAARWLEPQYAFLRAPSGRLAIESNNSCRVAEEAADRTDRGAVVVVPPGDYRVTLHRIDLEALAREKRAWSGAREVIVLTSGGRPAQDVSGLLPFRPSADLSWVGKIEVAGSTARGLVWFEDARDTFFANIDGGTAARMGLEPGRHLRTTVPATGHVLVTVFARSWQEGAKLKRPGGPELDEFGFGAITKPQRWDREALFCRRVKAARAVEDEHKTVWHEATFELLELEAAAPAKKAAAPLYAGDKRAYHHATLASKSYYEGDDSALAGKLSARLEGLGFDDALPLGAAVQRLDEAMAALQLTPPGDFSYEVSVRDETHELTIRPWAGLPNIFAVASARVDSFEVYFCSRLASGKWLLTGTLDEGDAERISEARPRVLMGAREDVPLAELLVLHRERLEACGEKADAVPEALADLARVYDDCVAAALD